jgi:hypothetical protein
MLRAAAIMPAALSAAVSLGACGSSSSPAAGRSASPTALGNALVQAADISGASKGYKVAIRMTEGVGSIQINATGAGAFNVPRKAGELNLRMSLPASSGLGQVDVREIVDHGTLYMHLPASLSGKLGKPWLEVDLAQVAKSEGISGLSALSGGQSSNPGQFLQYLEAASSNGIRNLGPATINGVRTTHYQGHLDLLKAAKAARPSQRAADEKAIAALKRLTGLSQLPVDVWVDSARLVRQIAMTYSVKVGGSLGQLNLTTQLDFTAYGPQPVPALPPPGQVSNLSSLMKSHAVPGATSSS